MSEQFSKQNTQGTNALFAKLGFGLAVLTLFLCLFSFLRDLVILRSGEGLPWTIILLVLPIPVFTVLGLIFSILGYVKKESHKYYKPIGLALNILLLSGMLILLFFGIAMLN